jgi:DNA-binding CsgD family transcriptional regulator
MRNMSVIKGDHHHAWYAISEEIACIYQCTDKSYSQIAKEFGIDRRTVKQMVQYHCIEPKPRRRLYEINQSFFASVDNEPKAYWLGFLMADCGITNPDDISIQLAAKDKDHLVALRAALDSTYPIHQYQREFPSVDFRIKSREMVNDLLKYGVTPRKSLTLKWPDNLDHYLYPHFIRGFIDGDGCFSSRPSLSVIATFSFAVRLQDVLMKACDLKKTALIRSVSEPMVSMAYSGVHQLDRIVRYLYADATIWLERKRTLVEIAISARLKEIKQIEDKRCLTKRIVYELRMHGLTLKEIADHLDIGTTTASRIIRNYNRTG